MREEKGAMFSGGTQQDHTVHNLMNAVRALSKLHHMSIVCPHSISREQASCIITQLPQSLHSLEISFCNTLLPDHLANLPSSIKQLRLKYAPLQFSDHNTHNTPNTHNTHNTHTIPTTPTLTTLTTEIVSFWMREC